MKPVFLRLRSFAVTGLLIAVAQGAVALPPGTSAEILERIRPIGSLRTADMPVAEAGAAPAEAA
ncbi:MAG: hypothetical protein V2I63_09505, partial [Pseudomonadales bacterium]|nr:hypothetical protein [Pseudomonadales bacterium]